MRQLIVESSGGLGNRLRVLLSGMRLAQMSQRRFRFIWNPSQDCGCTFPQLFVDTADRLAVLNVSPDRTYDDPTSSRSIDVQNSAEIIFVQSYHQLQLPRGDRNVRVEMADLWGSLQPVPWIRDRVEEFARNHFSTKTLGVHIRRGDHSNYRKLRASGLVDAQMKAFESEIEAYVERNPGARVFVASDDGAADHLGAAGGGTGAPSTVGRLRDRFGPGIVVHPARSLDRRSPEAIQDALIELLLLNRADYVLGSQWSSFSELSVMETLSRRRDLQQCLKLVGPNLMEARSSGLRLFARRLKQRLANLRR